MSGGSYDYAYDRAEDMADRLIEYSKDPLRIAFAKHLKQVAQAMHDIEWVDSGDYGEGREEESIKAVLGEHWKEITITEVLEQMYEIRDQIMKLVLEG